MDMPMELLVEFSAAEHAEADDVQPKQERNPSPKRTVDLRVVGEASNVPAEDECGQQPHRRRGNGSRNDFPPWLTERCAHVINESKEPYASDEFDDGPADKGHDKDRLANLWCDVHHKPRS